MSFRLRWNHPLPEEFRRIGAELAEATMERLREGDVHQTRRRIKEIRALLAFAEHDLEAQELVRQFRDVARAISGERDQATCNAALARLEKEPEAAPAPVFDEARAILEKQAKPAPDHTELLLQLETAQANLEIWHPSLRRKDIRLGLKRSYRRCRRALSALSKSSTEDAFHRLRRRVKQLWAQLRLIEKRCPKIAGERIKKADKLADLLGLEHDLAVLETRLAGTQAGDALAKLIDSTRETLQKASLNRAHRFLKKKPKAFMKKVR